MKLNCAVQIIVLGESEVGKTSLLHRFMHGTFRDHLLRTTVDRHTRTVNVKGNDVEVTLWDTAGQTMYNSLVRNYYKLANGVLLVYDVRNADTFLKLSKWLVDLKSINQNAEVIIAGNKCEEPDRKTVNVSMVNNFAQEENLEHVEVSAKSGENVDTIFHYLVEKILIAMDILPYSEKSLAQAVKSKSVEDIDKSILPVVVEEQMGSLPVANHDLNSSPSTENLSTPIGSTSSLTEESNLSRGPSGELSHTDDKSLSGDESICSAECALEYFSSLGEDVS